MTSGYRESLCWTDWVRRTAEIIGKHRSMCMCVCEAESVCVPADIISSTCPCHSGTPCCKRYQAELSVCSGFERKPFLSSDAAHRGLILRHIKPSEQRVALRDNCKKSDAACKPHHPQLSGRLFNCCFFPACVVGSDGESLLPWLPYR